MNLLPEDTLFYIRIKTSKKQDEKIIEYLNKEWKKSKKYVLIFNDCITFVKNALSYAQINYSHNPLDYSKTPYGVFNDIKNNNEVLESGQISVQSLQKSNYNKQLLDNILRGKL